MVVNYEYETEAFYDDVKSYKVEFIKELDDRIGICKEVIDSNCIDYKGRKISNFKFNKDISVFLDNMPLGLKRYYKEVLPKVRIAKDETILNGEAFMIGCDKTVSVMVTNKPLKDIDLIAYSHEFGHIPIFLNPTGDEYYEYMEVLPMYLEYLACKKLNDNNPHELFINQRMTDLKVMAKDYIRNNREIRNNESDKDKFYKKENLEIFKYFKSIDYALQLIECEKEDENAVHFLLAQNAYGNRSFKKIANYLDIDTRGCRKLLKEINK